MVRTKITYRHWDEIKLLVAMVLAALIAVVLMAQLAGAAAPKPLGEPPPVHVVSPWYGMFSAGEYPGSAPYVEVGSRVAPSTVVGTITMAYAGEEPEAFIVVAGVHGTVIEVMVEDGEMVSIGQPLFKIQPTLPPVTPTAVP